MKDRYYYRKNLQSNWALGGVSPKNKYGENNKSIDNFKLNNDKGYNNKHNIRQNKIKDNQK